SPFKDEAVFRFSNWFKKLGDEDKDKEAEEKEKELAEIAETRFLENKQKFRSLLIERKFSAEEWTLMKQFLDYPELAAIVVKMRRSQGVPGLRQNRRRCLTCEESLAGMPLTAHKTENCSIPYESRILVSKRLFGQRKCYGCGRMKEDGNCNCKSVPCRRCWRWNVPESFPHLQVMGTCQMVWKIRQETGHVPTEHEISDYTKRNDKIASIIQHKLEKFVAETERELVDAGRASNQKTEAELWWVADKYRTLAFSIPWHGAKGYFRKISKLFESPETI
ncbi:Protein CBG25066, partial [Caenorhabditis briggsae]